MQYAPVNQPILLTAFQVNECQHIISEFPPANFIFKQKYSFTYFLPKYNISSYNRLIIE